ncbi:twin-arginine translocase TatA/TatE family subunit [Thermodesulfobacteriota bacterium]
MLGIPGGIELIVILFIVLILFGGKKLPELMGGMGKGINSFKKGLSSSDSPDTIPDDRQAEENITPANLETQEEIQH